MSRKDWTLKPKIRFGFTKEVIAIIPSINYNPWKYRYPGCGAFEFMWIGFYVVFGVWKRRDTEGD